VNRSPKPQPTFGVLKAGPMVDMARKLNVDLPVGGARASLEGVRAPPGHEGLGMARSWWTAREESYRLPDVGWCPDEMAATVWVWCETE